MYILKQTNRKSEYKFIKYFTVNYSHPVMRFTKSKDKAMLFSDKGMASDAANRLTTLVGKQEWKIIKK